MLLFVLSDLANGMPLSISGYFINFIFEDNKYLGNPERCSDKEFTRMLTCTFNEGPDVGKAGAQLAGRLNMTNGFRYWVNHIPELTLNSKSGIDCQESIRRGIAVSGGAVVLLRLHAAPCRK